MEDSPINFDEKSARDIINFLIEKDSSAFKKFLPKIEKFNETSLYNLFQGIKNYKYNIEDNCYQFHLLLDKFNNFYLLLEEWYQDKNNYKYIQELWLKYVSLESLRDKNEEKIEQYLAGENIDFKTWPGKIKRKFIQICRATRDTFVFKFKKYFQNLPNSFKNILGKIKSLADYCKKLGENILSNYIIEYCLSILGATMNLEGKDLIKIKHIFLNLISQFTPSNFNVSEFFNSFKDNIFQLLTTVASGFKSKLFAISYGVTSFVQLITSINSCVQIVNKLKEIKQVKSEVETIYENFKKQKEKINNILNKNGYNDIFTSNETIDFCISEINESKNQLKKIIERMQNYIKESQDDQEKHAIGLASSILNIGIGVIGGILTGGALAAFYIGTAIGNGINTIINGVNIGLLEKCINESKRIIEMVESIEDEIDEFLWDTRKILNECKDINVSFCH